mmetsp:Transcript_98507/g.177868  ORF Transcript_98507/g.177868 Transcript_98507/m.177868 type:complete len:85 (+) Transcript_98507:387-641(+)
MPTSRFSSSPAEQPRRWLAVAAPDEAEAGLLGADCEPDAVRLGKLRGADDDEADEEVLPATPVAVSAALPRGSSAEASAAVRQR